MKNLLRTKNLRFKAIILTMMVVFTLANYSCDKIDEDQDHRSSQINDKTGSLTQLASNLSVEIADNTLIFSSEENFQRAIDFLNTIGDDAFDEWESEMGFISLRRSEAFNTIKDRPDNLIATLLNPQAEIVVGSHKFRIDFERSTVIAELYLPGEKLDPSVIKSSQRSFSFHDDVFALLEGSDNSKATYCGGRDQEYNMIFQGWPWGDIDRIYCRVRYYTIGIYNTVSIHMDRHFYYFDLIEDLTNGFYTTNGESTWENNKHNGTFDNISEERTTHGDLQNRPYQRTRRLTYLYLKVYFYNTYPEYPYWEYSINLNICCHSPGCTQ